MAQIRDSSRIVRTSLKELSIPNPILLVEDSSSQAEVLKAKLEERWQCEVKIANSYAQAKEFLKVHRHNCHIAICDLNLPDAPNGEIIDLVSRANVQCIAVTGSFGEELREKMVQKGVVDYIIKGSVNSYSYLVEQVGRFYRNQFIELLVVDDSEIQRELLTQILSVQNYKIHVANNGKEALEVLDNNPNISLLITDYIMPDVDGFMLTVEARKKFDKSQLAIIGISGQNNSDIGVQFIKNGANDFLIKPFWNDEIVCKINQNLDLLDYIRTINNLANRDHLTDLYNRRYFFVQGAKILKSEVDQGNDVALVMLDIDYFKKINDSHGHDVGDEVLIFFSKLLTEHFDTDLVARIGGEEFVILIKSMSKAEVASKLEAFRKALEESPISCGKVIISITASIGFDYASNHDIDSMLKIADESLYKAKEAGRNRVEG